MFRFVIGLLLASSFGFGQEAKEVSKAVPAATPSDAAALAFAEAARLYYQGQFDAAVQKYQQIISEKPNSSEAYAGLTRVYLKQKNVQQTNETILKGVQVADGPAVHVALGEVYFRLGKIPEAEREWVNVINSGHVEARAYLGLVRVDYALSLYRKAKAMLEKAHQLDPVDLDVQRYWDETLSLRQRVQTLEEYLATVKNDDAK